MWWCQHPTAGLSWPRWAVNIQKERFKMVELFRSSVCRAVINQKKQFLSLSIRSIIVKPHQPFEKQSWGHPCIFVGMIVEPQLLPRFSLNGRGLKADPMTIRLIFSDRLLLQHERNVSHDFSFFVQILTSMKATNWVAVYKTIVIHLCSTHNKPEMWGKISECGACAFWLPHCRRWPPHHTPFESADCTFFGIFTSSPSKIAMWSFKTPEVTCLLHSIVFVQTFSPDHHLE